MNEQQLILLAETGTDDEAREALSLLRQYYDSTYMMCSDCDYLVVKEKDCCMNRIDIENKQRENHLIRLMQNDELLNNYEEDDRT